MSSDNNSNGNNDTTIFPIFDDHLWIKDSDIQTIIPIIDYILSKAKTKDEELTLQDLLRLVNSLTKMTTFLYILMINLVLKQNTHPFQY